MLIPASETFLIVNRHIKETYATVNVLLEPRIAREISRILPFPVYASRSNEADKDEVSHSLHSKTDIVSTFGGDGTILHASSLFANSPEVPPILSFSMGTLGFLGEWKFSDHKRAFREVYMSGATSQIHTRELRSTESDTSSATWISPRGRCMGSGRTARVLMRNRLNIGIYDAGGTQVNTKKSAKSSHEIHAMNEVIIHRGRDPHHAIVEVFVGGRFLTEAVADGMIISTPTGSTAYSLSSGGSIVHPLVSSLLLTPICPRSLSFRPLVLPATTPVTLRLSEKNRGREVEVSIDGVRRSECIGVGMEVRVSCEAVKSFSGKWHGGVPCIMRRTAGVGENDDGWVGGLNGLLKFNYPFGEES